MPFVSCPRCVRARSEIVNGNLRFKPPNKGCKQCGGKGIVYYDSVPLSYYKALEGWAWHPFEENPILGWIANGIFAFVLFGTIFTILFDFTPALTYIDISDSWRTIAAILVIYFIFGGLMGLLGYLHYQGVGFASDGLTTKMFLCFWGLVISSVIGYFFNHLTEVQGAVLRPALFRCAMGAIAGFFAGVLMGSRKQ